MINLQPFKFKKVDTVLLLTLFAIFTFGLFFLYSATYQLRHGQTGLLQPNFLLRQIIWFALGIVLGLIIFRVDYKNWQEWAYPLYGLTLMLLISVLVWGESRFGAQRWIALGNVGFQPSEFSKLIVVLTLARYLGQKEIAAADNLPWWQTHLGLRFLATVGVCKSIRKVTVAFLIVAVPFVLIVKQPDLGTAVTLIPVLFTMLFVWGLPLGILALVSWVGLAATPFLWQLLKDYQKRRILIFLNPALDPLGAGYTVIQSKIAIGSGKLFGRGWLSGTQGQLNFLPERHTDFIFSVVGEEGGFLGALFLILLYAVFIWRALTIAEHTKNFSGRLLASGIIAMLAFQILVNIAMTIGLVPVVGLPLPLLSYGGSSLITTLVSVAILLNIGSRR